MVREGLIRLGKISESTSQASLLVKKPFELAQPPTIEQTKKNELLESKDRVFKMMLDQWDIHSDLNWRIKATAQAEKWKDKLESARLLLAKKEAEG
jgi:hypothetical protein